MRQAGYLLVVLLTLLCLALHQRSTWRAQRLLDGEELARQRIETIHRLATHAIRLGDRPQLRNLLADPELAPLILLDDLARPGLSFARDEVYVYGMAQTSDPAEQGQDPLPGFILRAWPAKFGETGDLLLHLDSRGNYYHGQNNKGRSGVTVDFPPPFPDPDLGSRRAGWWPRSLQPPAQR